MAFFTKENARLYAVQALARRRELSAERKAKAKLTKDLAKRLEEIEAKIAAASFSRPSVESGYADSRLREVREHLVLVDSLIKACTDSERLDQLTRAQLRLSQQEFALAGRPMPGQLRPTAAHARRVTVDLQQPFNLPAIQPQPAPPIRSAIEDRPPAARLEASAAAPVNQVATPGPRAPGKVIIGPGSFRRAAS